METLNELLDVIKPINLEPLQTYCFALNLETLKSDTENFEKKNVNFTTEGLRVIYHCHKDNRDYEVLIKTL